MNGVRSSSVKLGQAFEGWSGGGKSRASKQIEVCSGKLKFVTDFDEPYVCGPPEILHSPFIFPLAVCHAQSNL